MAFKKKTGIKGHGQQDVPTQAPKTYHHEGIHAPASLHSTMLQEDRAQHGHPLDIPKVPV